MSNLFENGQQDQPYSVLNSTTPVSLSIAKSPATVHNVLVYYLSLYLIMRIEKHRDKQFERLPIILRTIAPEKCVFSYSYFICTKLLNISGIISKNGRNDAKQLNVSVVTVSNDAKPKMLKKQRKAELSRRTVCKSLPDEK